MTGYDISEYQSAIQYNNFKGDFAILRCGIRGYGKAGNMVADKKVADHYNGLKNKCKIAFYFFSQAMNYTEGVAEANFALNVIRGIDPKWTGVVYIDTEWSNGAHTGRADNISKYDRTQAIKGFCDTIVANKLKAGIYASESWFNSQLIYDDIKHYILWVAKWGSKPVIKCQLWQYSSSINPAWCLTRIDGDECFDEAIWYDLTPNPYPMPTTTIKRTIPNMHGDDVKWVQYELNRRGYGLKLDGYFGLASDKATRDFQAKNGLEADGKVGGQTRKALAKY